MQTLECYISEIKFHDTSPWHGAGCKFLIARTETRATIKGILDKPVIGEHYLLYGDWLEEKGENRRFGDSYFAFETFEVLIEKSPDGLRQYLSRHINGMGDRRATNLINHFSLKGDDPLSVLMTNPERCKEVPSLPPSVVDEVIGHFNDLKDQDPVAYCNLAQLLGGTGFPRKLTQLLVQDFGAGAYQAILDNPYLLLDYPRVGWERVDEFATTKAGYSKGGIERHKAAVVEVLNRAAASEGHTYLDENEMVMGVWELIKQKMSGEAIEGLRVDGVVHVDNPANPVRPPSGGIGGNGHANGHTNGFHAPSQVYPTGRPNPNQKTERKYSLMSLRLAECRIAERIAEIQATAEPLRAEIDPEGLEGEQVGALDVIRENGFAVLCGPPGTGKSFISARILLSIDSNGSLISVTAPTGKAAKRIGELLESAQPGHNIRPSTVHKALGLKGSKSSLGVPSASAKVNRGRSPFAFGHNRDNPIPADFAEQDELSMTDVRLMASYLDALPLGCRAMVVGDPHQLPSVGPGAVLRDIIAAGVPTARLTEPRRNSGAIVRACHDILKGRVPKPCVKFNMTKEDKDNWIHIEESNQERIADIVIGLHLKTKRDPMWDLQCISAKNKGMAIACEELNAKLGMALNPPQPGMAGLDDLINGAGSGGTGSSQVPQPFRCGDKVVRTKNDLVDEMMPIGFDAMDERDEDFDWSETGLNGDGTTTSWNGMEYILRDCAVVNGDLGIVLGFTKERGHIYVIVKFRNPERLCRLPLGDCYLQPAYAITCHKAQGSGFPVVIVPIHRALPWNPRTNSGLASREWLYTAISRSEEKLITVGELGCMRDIVGRKTVHRRKTRLAEFIRDGLPEDYLPKPAPPAFKLDIDDDDLAESETENKQDHAVSIEQNMDIFPKIFAPIGD